MIFGLVEKFYVEKTGVIPDLTTTTFFAVLAVVLPYMAGAATTRYAGGMVRLKRVISGTVAGALMGVFYAIFWSAIIPPPTSFVDFLTGQKTQLLFYTF